MNKNPSMNKSEENLTKCINPKKSLKEQKLDNYWKAQEEINNIVGNLK